MSPTAGSARLYWTKLVLLFGDKAAHCRYIKTAVILALYFDIIRGKWFSVSSCCVLFAHKNWLYWTSRSQSVRRTSGNLLNVSPIFLCLYRISCFVHTTAYDVLANEQGKTGPTGSGCLIAPQNKHRGFEICYSREQAFLFRCKHWHRPASSYPQTVLLENGVPPRTVL